MRIISGKWKGRRLTAPKNLPTRPTTDFAKEGLFNILTPQLQSSASLSVLDLFAGIGGISFEFASRGAAQVVAVEQYPKCVAYLKQTAETLAMETLEVYARDVFSFLSQVPYKKFDFIFADPPFDLPKEDYQKLHQLIFEKAWLKPNGLFILEHASRESWEELPYFQSTRKYGNVQFSFYKEDC